MIKVMGTGRLVADPVVHELPSNDTCVCRFTIAVNEYFKSQDEKKKKTSFFEFEAWDSGGRTLAKYANKGDLIAFDATPRQNKWTDNEGNNRSKIVFRLDKFQIISKSQRNEDVDAEDVPDNDDDSSPF